jgi:hypothetical protein
MGRNVPQNTKVPPIAAVLGAAGAAPFIFYAWQHERLSLKSIPAGDVYVDELQRYLPFDISGLKCGNQLTVRQRYISYAACVLSFMGAVHWGVAMMAPSPPRAQYFLSVIPALVAWRAMNMDATSTVPHVTMAAAFLAVHGYDEMLQSAKRMPSWYTSLRTPLTTAVIAASMFCFSFSKEKILGTG